MKRYQRDATTRLAPPELAAVHPLGKSPVIIDGGVKIAESGAIVDYVIRTYGQGNGKPAMMPAIGTPEYEAYNEWLHYSEGSAMLPLMLNLYVSRLKEAGAPLHPRIDSEIANHLGYVDGALKGREFFIGQSLTGADIQMSFVGEMAKVFDKLGPYPSLAAWLTRHACASGVPALDREGRGLPLCEIGLALMHKQVNHETLLRVGFAAPACGSGLHAAKLFEPRIRRRSFNRRSHRIIDSQHLGPRFQATARSRDRR